MRGRITAALAIAMFVGGNGSTCIETQKRQSEVRAGVRRW